MKKVIELLEKAKKILTTLEYGDKDIFERAEDQGNIYTLLNKAIEELQTPRWYTPERWEAETGKPWPDNGAVYFRVFTKKLPDFIVYTYEDALRVLDMARSHTGIDVEYQIVCATEDRPPPQDWRPEETP